MLTLPSLITLRNKEESFTSAWADLRKSFNDKIEELGNKMTAGMINEQTYKETMLDLQKEVVDAERTLTRKWLTHKLAFYQEV